MSLNEVSEVIRKIEASVVSKDDIVSKWAAEQSYDANKNCIIVRRREMGVTIWEEIDKDYFASHSEVRPLNKVLAYTRHDHSLEIASTVIHHRYEYDAKYLDKTYARVVHSCKYSFGALEEHLVRACDEEDNQWTFSPELNNKLVYTSRMLKVGESDKVEVLTHHHELGDLEYICNDGEYALLYSPSTQKYSAGCRCMGREEAIKYLKSRIQHDTLMNLIKMGRSRMFLRAIENHKP